MNYKNHDGMIDTRDLEEHMKDLKKTESPDDDDAEYIQKIEKLKQELGHEEFEQGITLISEYEFKHYAKEMAFDCGYLSGSAYGSPSNPIEFFVDWEGFSDQLKIDYDEIDFDDTTYYYQY